METIQEGISGKDNSNGDGNANDAQITSWDDVQLYHSVTEGSWKGG